MRACFYPLPLIIALLFAACGSPTGSPTPSALGQTLTAEDGTFSFQYPTGWYAQVISGQVTIANNQTAAENSFPTPGQFVARMFTGPISAVAGLTDQSTPTEVLQRFAESLGDLQFGAPADLTIGPYPAARVEGSSPEGQGIILALNLGGGHYGIVSAVSAPGEMAQYEPTLLSILATLQYQPPSSTAATLDASR
ncbi:MAG: hypothetical protein JNM70_16750 [Anaerolineae bacterium]|nr:hypothetical protein [Anaerolineae bacterium]